MVETSDEWIVQRTGIKQRHIADDHQSTSDLASEAARLALSNADLEASDIDGVIVCTTTPDKTFPSVAVHVQKNLKIPPGFAFDLQAVCSGFVYGLSVADGLIRTGQAKRILLVGAEKMSSVVDWTDRTTCVLFADGAGAVILERDESGEGTVQDRGILSTHLYANGEFSDLLYTDGGPSTTQHSGHVIMHGRDVFKHAVTYMSDVVREALEDNNLTAQDVDWLVPHQANSRILEATAKKLGFPMEKVVVTVDRHGNTSAASVPLALHESVSDGRIQRGDLLLLEAMGAGLTWGSSLVRF